jgi:hypothetical protein
LPEIVAKRHEIEFGTVGPERSIVDDVVVRGERLFMLASTKTWGQVLEHGHGMGHEGVQKTLHQLCATFTSGDNKLV